MGVNPFQLIQLMRGGNPQQIVMNLLKQEVGSNPIMSNALDMVQRGDAKGVEALARNLAKEKGIDPDKAIGELRKQFGM